MPNRQMVISTAERQFRVEVAENDTASHLKAKIQKQENFKSELQSLVIDGREVSDPQLLTTVAPDDKINLVVKPKPTFKTDLANYDLIWTVRKLDPGVGAYAPYTQNNAILFAVGLDEFKLVEETFIFYLKLHGPDETRVPHLCLMAIPKPGVFEEKALVDGFISLRSDRFQRSSIPTIAAAKQTEQPTVLVIRPGSNLFCENALFLEQLKNAPGMAAHYARALADVSAFMLNAEMARNAIFFDGELEKSLGVFNQYLQGEVENYPFYQPPISDKSALTALENVARAVQQEFNGSAANNLTHPFPKLIYSIVTLRQEGLLKLYPDLALIKKETALSVTLAYLNKIIAELRMKIAPLKLSELKIARDAQDAQTEYKELLQVEDKKAESCFGPTLWIFDLREGLVTNARRNKTTGTLTTLQRMLEHKEVNYFTPNYEGYAYAPLHSELAKHINSLKARGDKFVIVTSDPDNMRDEIIRELKANHFPEPDEIYNFNRYAQDHKLAVSEKVKAATRLSKARDLRDLREESKSAQFIENYVASFAESEVGRRVAHKMDLYDGVLSKMGGRHENCYLFDSGFFFREPSSSLLREEAIARGYKKSNLIGVNSSIPFQTLIQPLCYAMQIGPADYRQAVLSRVSGLCSPDDGLSRILRGLVDIVSRYGNNPDKANRILKEVDGLIVNVSDKKNGGQINREVASAAIRAAINTESPSHPLRNELAPATGIFRWFNTRDDLAFIYKIMRLPVDGVKVAPAKKVMSRA